MFSVERVDNGNPHTRLVGERGYNLCGEKLSNIYESKNDLEVPLLGIYFMGLLAKTLQ